MEFKEYQERAVREVEQFFRLLAEERAAGRGRYASTEAFRRHLQALRQTLHVYSARENGIGHDLPTVCIKVPTGGGKTLLATQALGSIYRTILKERNGTGLAMWVVPIFRFQVLDEAQPQGRDWRDELATVLR